MDILKRNGAREPLKLEKIGSRIKKLTYGLNERVDPDIVSTKVVSGLYDGVSSTELDQLSAETAASMVTVHPDFGKLAARIAITALLGMDKAAELIADIAPTYFASIAVLVSAFFGADALKKK